MGWTKRGSGKETTGRKVALVEPPALVSTEEPRPATAEAEEVGRRRASRRLKLLAGLLSRGKGDAID